MILIMIDGSEKRPVVKATFELQSSCVFERAVILESPKNTRIFFAATDTINLFCFSFTLLLMTT